MAHVLLVAAWAPPSPNVGARRTANFARFVQARGHRVSVIASSASGAGDVEGACRTVRAFDAMASPLNWRRAQVAALSGTAAAPYEAKPSLLSRLLVPDPTVVSWAPFATRAALALHAGDPVDCVVSSSPPLASHLVGLALASRGVPWLADFRDGWSFDDMRSPFALGVLAAADRALERRVMARADRVVTTTDAMAEAAAALTPGRVATIPNGYDPSTVAEPRPFPAHDSPILVVHTGKLGARASALGPVLDALKRVAGTGRPVRLLLAGPRTREETALLEAVDPRVALHAGSVPWERSVEMQRNADLLLLLVDEARPGLVPAKLYEYLAARRPILVVGTAGEAVRIVQRTRTGLVVPPDPSRVADALAQLAGRLSSRDEDAVAEYDWRNLAARFDAAIAEAMESAAARRRAG